MADATEHLLKLPNKTLQRVGFALFLVWFSTLFVMDIPMSDRSFPPHITESARIIFLCSFPLFMITCLVFTFYRDKATAYLDETGIQLPNHAFIPWERIQWYRVDVFNSNIGTRRVILKLDGDKAALIAENNEALNNLVYDIKQRLRLHNPLAKDFRELKSTIIRAYIIISIVVAIHVIVSILTGFDKKYMAIFTPVLFITIGAILIEYSKFPNNHR